MSGKSVVSKREALSVIVDAESKNMPLTSEQVGFLVSYMEHGTHTAAAKASGSSVELHKIWMVNSPTYADTYNECHNAFVEKLKEAAINRALHGTKEPVFHQGVQCGEATKYDNVLLMRMLESHDDTYVKKTQTKQETEATHRLVVVLDGDQNGRPSISSEGGEQGSLPDQASVSSVGGSSGDGEVVSVVSESSADSREVPEVPDRVDSPDESIDDTDSVEDVGGRSVPSGSSGEHEDQPSE